jgi:peptidoglycan LD-endopeptidase LytH
MRRQRRRFFRDDVLAPWMTLAVIGVVWWLGASALGRDLTPRDVSPVARPLAPEPAPRTVAPAAATPDSAPPHPEPPPTMSSHDIGELRTRALIVPVEGVAASALRSSFDESRSSGRSHEALDILASRGAPVIAAQDGVIAKLFTSVAGGLTVYQFDAEGRYCFYYAHLDGYASGLREGQRVTRGDVLGYVGTTGNAPEGTPHLHFAIFKLGPEKKWWEGEPIDPFLVLR